MPPFKDKGQGRFRPCPRIWRSGRDSNPRVVAHKLISSQPRYDRFDTAAYFLLPRLRRTAYYSRHGAACQMQIRTAFCRAAALRLRAAPRPGQNSRCFWVGWGSKGVSSWWRRMNTCRVFSVTLRPLCLGTV